jgi:hypothetical protein
MAAGPNPEGQLFVSLDAGLSWIEVEDASTAADLLFAPPRSDMLPYTLYTACDLTLCRSRGVTGANVSWQPVDGAPRSTTLASGTDGERVIVYVGSPGGFVPTAGRAPTGQATFPASVLAQSIALGGGVYRWTSLQPEHWVYMPRVFHDMLLP